MKDIFDSALGTMAGIIGSIGGLGLLGLMIALGIFASCCCCMLLAFLPSFSSH